jgi:hypothetical protein
MRRMRTTRLAKRARPSGRQAAVAGLVVAAVASAAVIAAVSLHDSGDRSPAVKAVSSTAPPNPARDERGGLTAAEKSDARVAVLASPIVTQLADGITVSARNVFPLTGLIADDSFRGAAVVLRFSRPVHLPVGSPVMRHRSDQETGPVLLADFATRSASIGPAVRSLIVDVDASTGDVLAFGATPTCTGCLP